MVGGPWWLGRVCAGGRGSGEARESGGGEGGTENESGNESGSRGVGAAAAAEEETREVAMDVSLWGELQRYIDLEMVAAQLPVHAFFRARGVCKKWNSLPWNRAFLQQHSHTCLPKPYFILHGDQGCHQAMLVRGDGRWVLRPLPAFAFQHDSTSVASGVVCTCETDLTFDREGCVVRGTVFSIHTKVFRRLPHLTVDVAQGFDCSKLAVDARSGAYQVLVACGSGQVRVYDSVAGTWTTRASSPVSLFKEEDATHFGGVMYIKWGGRHREVLRPRPRLFAPLPAPELSEPKVFAYNFKDDAWSVLPVAPPVLLRTEQNAQIMLVKGLGEWRGALRDLTYDAADHVVRVWEFDQESWVEVDRMPGPVLDWFLDPEGSTYKSLGQRGKILRTCYCEHYVVLWNYGFAQTLGAARLVLYDMGLKSWETITVNKDWACSCPFAARD